MRDTHEISGAPFPVNRRELINLIDERIDQKTRPNADELREQIRKELELQGDLRELREAIEEVGATVGKWTAIATDFGRQLQVLDARFETVLEFATQNKATAIASAGDGTNIAGDNRGDQKNQ